MPVDISMKWFENANLRKSLVERKLVRIIKGDSEEITVSSLGGEQILRAGLGKLWL